MATTAESFISNGAEIAASNQGLGDAGNLQIDAERVLLEDRGKITASSSTGQGGNIELNLKDSLLLKSDI